MKLAMRAKNKTPAKKLHFQHNNWSQLEEMIVNGETGFARTVKTIEAYPGAFLFRTPTKFECIVD